MKHPFFAHLGDGYPRHLEARFDRILTKIEQFGSPRRSTITLLN